MGIISSFDPSRKTVGTIYRDAQINGEKGVIIGDVNHEIKKGLVEDINIAIREGTEQLNGEPFYLAMYEKYDLMLKKGLVRIPKITSYRPYPEQDSMVFHVFPSSNSVYFCWALPHRSQMLNMLNCPDLFDPDQISMIRRWDNMQLEYYGFKKDENGNWVENPLFRGDKLMGDEDQNPKVSLFNVVSSPEDSSPVIVA